MAGLIGVVQKDLKRIIAYSTMSQLGYMTLAIGISEYELSLYHMVNHAYYKGLLFISVGVIIHSMNDEQDIRGLGGVVRRLPYTYVCIMIGSLSLMGLPYMTGNYSKETIIEVLYNQGQVGYILGMISVILTGVYSIKILKYGLITIPGSRRLAREGGWFVGLSDLEAPRDMYVPMMILSILSIVNGYMMKDIVIGVGNGEG